MLDILYMPVGCRLIGYVPESRWIYERNIITGLSRQWKPGPRAGFKEASSIFTPVISIPPYEPEKVNVLTESADPGSLWSRIRAMIAVRKSHPVLCCGDLAWVDCGTPAVAAYLRSESQERMLVLQNLSAAPRAVTCALPGDVHGKIVDLLPGDEVRKAGGRVSLTLQPYEYRWLLIP